MAEQQNFSQFTIEQLMLLKRDKLREISKSLKITYQANTLKQELADNIYKHFHKETKPIKNRDYKIRDSVPEETNTSYTLTEIYLNNFLKIYTKTLNNQFTINDDLSYNDSVDIFIENLIKREYPFLKFILNRVKNPYKFRILINATFSRPRGESKDFTLFSRYYYPFEEDLLSLLTTEFTTRIEDLKIEQTGWTLTSFNDIQLHIQQVKVFPGGTYVKIPHELMKRKALINVDNCACECKNPLSPFSYVFQGSSKTFV